MSFNFRGLQTPLCQKMNTLASWRLIFSLFTPRAAEESPPRPVETNLSVWQNCQKTSKTNDPGFFPVWAHHTLWLGFLFPSVAEEWYQICRWGNFLMNMVTLFAKCMNFFHDYDRADLVCFLFYLFLWFSPSVNPLFPLSSTFIPFHPISSCYILIQLLSSSFNIFNPLESSFNLFKLLSSPFIHFPPLSSFLPWPSP